MLELKIIVFLVISLLCEFQFNSAEQTEIKVSEERYSLYFIEVPAELGLIQECIVEYKFRLCPNLEVEQYTPTICGAKVKPSGSECQFILQAKNAIGGIIKEETFRDRNRIKHLNSEIFLNDAEIITINCQKHFAHTKYCTIIDEDNGKHWNQCYLNTIVRTNRTFSCYTYDGPAIIQLLAIENISVFVRPKAAQPKMAIVEETDISIVLRCEFVRIAYESCLVQLPDRQTKLFAFPNTIVGRYAAVYNYVSEGRCALAIPKPLTESEIGIWRMTNDGASEETGCLFYVGDSKEAILTKELEYLKNDQELNFYVSDDVKISEITCTMPFVVENCYLRDPMRQIYYPDVKTFPFERFLGKCSFKNLTKIPGTWLCGAYEEENESEFQQRIEVNIKPRSGEVITEAKTARVNTTVDLMCKSAFTDPLDYCAFVSPQGKVHFLATTSMTKTEGRFQYLGRGRDYGDCGITIDAVQDVDFGLWQCQFKVHGENDSSKFEIFLTVE